MSEQNEMTEQSVAPLGQMIGSPVSVWSTESSSQMRVAPQGGSRAGGCGCAADSRVIGTEAASYVYAIGRVEARFPNLAAEKEFVQATGRTDTAGKTDQQTFHAVLSQRENRYLVRQLCWVLNVQGMETYLLLPRDPADTELLVDALRPAASPGDVDVVIGLRGPIAPP